ncbi:MAG: peptidylprolyl isomerase [Burkholderiales bacterium]|nr:peptidylprolyl isomerase [Burkholderiales bacterium]
MGISVNGIELTDAAIGQELPHHQKADNPLKQTVHELVLRMVLLQEADRLGLTGDTEDDRIEALFAHELDVPEADEETCVRYYRNNPEKFSNGEMIEVRHILLQVTPNAPLELLRETGEAMLAELKEHPERFAEIAMQYSNCPSGAVGGNLGQLTRGQTVPEFETFVFRLNENQLADRLLETRFGLHIVQVLRKIEGKLLPFETVRDDIRQWLRFQSWQRAMHQYLQILVGQADVQGVTLEGVGSPLVQ